MKKIIISKCMNLIKKYHDYDNTKLAEIEYGLTGFYLTISKLIVISLLCILIGTFKEMIIFTFIYGILRSTSYGIHATKSWICWITSTIIFTIIPLLCIVLKLNIIFKFILGIILIILMFKNSPADTKKKPIINKKRRLIYKLISTIISIIYLIFSLKIKNNYLANCFIFGMLLQNCLISPITYKIFHQPFNNYKKYIELHPNYLN